MQTFQEIFQAVIVDGQNYRIATKYRPAQSHDLIVFIHGLGCSTETFTNAWDFTDLADYGLLAIDLLGFGNSDKPAQFSYRLEEQANILHKILTQFTGKRIHLVGHSMGGAISVLLTRTFMQTSFISVEGNLAHTDCGVISRSTKAMSEADFVDTGFALLKQSLSSYPDKTFALQTADPIAFHRSSISLIEWSDSDRLLDIFAALDIPKTYIYGEKNAHIPVLKMLDGKVPTRQIPDAAHFPMIENTDAFYLELLDFLKAPKEA